MAQSLKQRTAILERKVKERAETVKKALKEYREIVRTNTATRLGNLRPRDRARLHRKRLDVERANAEYMQLQKELETLRSRLQPQK